MDHIVDDIFEKINVAGELFGEFLKKILMYPTDMKRAIIGYVERAGGMQPQILLDRDKCIGILKNQGMTEEEAIDYFEFNTIGAWMGEGTPLFATLKK